MHQDMLPSTSVIQRLLKTNRLPTDEEREEILESVLPTKAKLKVVEEQISDVMVHIDALKLQIEQAENKLHRLREEEAAILDVFADHDRVFAPFRKLPEDVLREICVACVQDAIPELSYGDTPMPYILGQICSGMRHVALTTPVIWASMGVDLKQNSSYHYGLDLAETFKILAQRAIKWFERAGGLALTVSIRDSCALYSMSNDSGSDPTSILFDALLSYSSRWKEIHFTSDDLDLPTSLTRTAALAPADVPLLQSASFYVNRMTWHPVLLISKLLTAPTLRHVTLTNAVRMFTVNWAVLTSVTLGDTKSRIGEILQQTSCLEFCDISVHYSHEDYADAISLPFLKVFIVGEEIQGGGSPGAHSILNTITAPILERFETRVEFFDLSLSGFLSRSPHIVQLKLLYFDKDQSLMETMEILRHCPSLTILSLQSHAGCLGTRDADRFLRAFVEQGNNGTICPRLQDFLFYGQIDFPLEALRIFLEAKQGGISMLNISPWKSVHIIVAEINSSEKRQQISDLVLQKQAAGLDVRVYEGWIDDFRQNGHLCLENCVL